MRLYRLLMTPLLRMTDRSLTAQQETFAAGIAKGFTQADAYREAYPKSKLWADETVWAAASRLAALYKVSTRVRELMDKAAKANEITVERVMRELAKVAFGDARRVMSWGPGGVNLIESSELTDDAAAIVSEVAQTITKDGGTIKVKAHDKLKALELIGRSMGMFRERGDGVGSDGGNIEVTRIELVSPEDDDDTES
jgi:phage terminase small subunit